VYRARPLQLGCSTHLDCQHAERGKRGVLEREGELCGRGALVQVGRDGELEGDLGVVADDEGAL